MSEIDIKQEFLDEATELLDDCEEIYAKLADDLHSIKCIDHLFRNLHTVKGSAGVVGFMELSKFVHRVEDLVNIYRENGSLTEQSRTVLLGCNDSIASWVEELKDDFDYSPDAENIGQHLKILEDKLNLSASKHIQKQEEISGFGFFEDMDDTSSKLPKVLVVDDEASILSIMETYLMDEPIEVFTATSAKEGLEIFRTNSIDVIVSDLSMPEITGLEFVKQVRKEDEKVEVIFLSAHADRSSLEDFIKLRTFAFVDKSNAHYEIVTAVNNALKSKKVSDALTLMTVSYTHLTLPTICSV